MSTIGVGNAPCSWGALEFEGLEGETIGYDRILDELTEAGYTGTELGDWGYMPTDPHILRHELSGRNLTMLGAFVPVALADPAALDAGIRDAVKVARLLAAVATRPQPWLVLADANGTVPHRVQHAGRISPGMGLDADGWRVFSRGVERIARVVRDETGLCTVFHHHCAGYVETPDEIDRLLDLTDPDLVGLALDTGHYTYGCGRDDARIDAALARYGERIAYLHFKDCSAEVAARARTEGWDYFKAVRRGVFCELGRGAVDFSAVVAWLHRIGYDGYVVVEQDVLPGMGTPRESAVRNRRFLRTIGL
ncbi:MAG: TIM barrel protein [Anaerolineae bacterium]|jgi:inosose dehydratase